MGGAAAGPVTKWVRAGDGAIFGTPSHSSTRAAATATAALIGGHRAYQYRLGWTNIWVANKFGNSVTKLQ